MGHKVPQGCADPAEAEELALGDALFAVLRVSRLKVQKVVGVSGFGVQICGKTCVGFHNPHVQEMNLRKGRLHGEFNGWVNGVEVVEE